MTGDIYSPMAGFVEEIIENGHKIRATQPNAIRADRSYRPQGRCLGAPEYPWRYNQH